MIPILQGIAALNTLLSLGRNERQQTVTPPVSSQGDAFTRALDQATRGQDGHSFANLSTRERVTLVRQLGGEPAVVTLSSGTRILGTIGYLEVRSGEPWLNIGDSKVPIDSIESILPTHATAYRSPANV
jgi:hypothetical protein